MNEPLPDFVIAEIFKDSLIVLDEAIIVSGKNDKKMTVTPTAAEQEKIYMGDNRKQVTILINDENAAVINDEWMQTLINLLKGCKLTMLDIALLNFNIHPLSFAELQKQLQPKILLLIHVSTQQIQLPFTIPFYQKQNYAGCTIITAPAAALQGGEQTAAVKAEKRKLWEVLKQVFSV